MTFLTPPELPSWRRTVDAAIFSCSGGAAQRGLNLAAVSGGPTSRVVAVLAVERLAKSRGTWHKRLCKIFESIGQGGLY